ncbi:hypothetical protein, partial [Dactylosporangium matsuzakiense]|uniref:hypothetical protein n=1 Tax=Dactylosporangium matsuzakiense TaxID=53360 RepID=UPI0022F30BAE
MANDKDGAAQVVTIMTSLSAVMREETQRLETGARAPELAEQAQAKARLVGVLEERFARESRLNPGWPDTLDALAREAFTTALGELRAASMVNAALLERHIELSAELMDAIAAE